MLISLVGLPGAGKSTIGRRLAKRLGSDFVDVDQQLEAIAGCSIAAYFERHGEDAFRALETKALASLVESSRPSVIATGGGIVLDPANRDRLRRLTRCVYLHAEPGYLVPRIARRNTRPLFHGADPAQKLSELYAARDSLYRDCACLVVPIERASADATAATIVDALESQSAASSSER